MGCSHVLQPGDEATAEPGVIHNFANETDEPVRFQVELTPGHRGFEQALQIGYGLAEDGLTNDKALPKSLVHTAVLMEMSETRVVGPIRVLVPLLKVLARWGRRRGADAALIERYVRYSVLVGREVALARAAHRTEPRVRDVVEVRARRDAAVGVAVRGVVDESAGLADPLLSCRRRCFHRPQGYAARRE